MIITPPFFWRRVTNKYRQKAETHYRMYSITASEPRELGFIKEFGGLDAGAYISRLACRLREKKSEFAVSFAMRGNVVLQPPLSLVQWHLLSSAPNCQLILSTLTCRQNLILNQAMKRGFLQQSISQKLM